MLCVRCSHPLPPRADRCLRCFALNPPNPPGPLSQPLHDSGPARPLSVPLESDPPAAPIALSFNDELLPVTEPESVPVPVPVPAFDFVPVSVPVSESRNEPQDQHKHGNAQRNPNGNAAARVLAWSTDALLLSTVFSACVAATLSLAHVRYPLDFLRETSALWLTLLAALGFAWSLVFGLASRTPGMALAGLRLRSLRGGNLKVGEAFARAALSLPSAALGLYGFWLALLDRRGQTLHDKLTHAVVD
jgi:uncharacterized RDD family membrane protein YckC